MAKFYGEIGFAISKETAPGVYTDTIERRFYYGEVNSRRIRITNGASINDNVNVSDEISIVSDPFANEHYFAMKYVTYMGVKWKVENISVQFPRLVLSLGGMYNE